MANSNSSNPQNRVGIHLVVKGLVQGVFFRASTQKTAEGLGLKGWAKNLANGDVEVVAYGDQAATKILIDFVKVGPSAARVDDITIRYIDYSDKYFKFEVL